jgi:hypothetical protein
MMRLLVLFRLCVACHHTTPCAVTLVIFVLQFVLPAVVSSLPLVAVPCISCIFLGTLDIFLPRVAMVLVTVVWSAVSQERGVLDPGFTS